MCCAALVAALGYMYMSLLCEKASANLASACIEAVFSTGVVAAPEQTEPSLHRRHHHRVTDHEQ